MSRHPRHRTMASSFPRLGASDPPLGGSGRASWRARASQNSSSPVSSGDAGAAGRRHRPRVPTSRSLSARTVLTGGATATVLFAAGTAHAELSKPPVEDLEGASLGDETEQPIVSTVVAFYDLDHTIIDTNSNKHWITKEIGAGRVTPKLVFTAIYWFAKYAMGQGQGAEAAGAEAAMAYAGKSSKQLKKEVRDVFDDKLKHRMRPGCGPSMDMHKQRNERIVICTSSWQYAAQYAAYLFGCETDPENIISSVMEERNGKLTGAIAEIAYGDGKYLVTKKWCDKNGVDLADCYFYSDSMSDVLLLEKVGHPVVVNPDPRLRKHAEGRGWVIKDWGKAEEKDDPEREALARKKGLRFF